jgi:predicted O-methyltransferase YrrM
MNLSRTLSKIAIDFNLDADELIAYADEDTETGWDRGEGDWPEGSLWQVEGQTLYALIRAIKPKHILELGTWHGCSATHILMAMQANDNGAILDAVDRDTHGISPGNMIPEYLTDPFTFYLRDAMEWMTETTNQYDFIFEDTNHTIELTCGLWMASKPRLSPGGFMLSHDALHHAVGNAVRMGIKLAGGVPFTYITEPSDCGLAIEQKLYIEESNEHGYKNSGILRLR